MEKRKEKDNEVFLYEKLREYGKSDAYPFHMPGHKRNPEVIKKLMGQSTGFLSYEVDITEIEGFDNLHHAEGILLEAQQRAAVLYGALESFYLINGSTCGLLAAVFACTSQKGKILMSRNCHKAVYHAVELRELEAVYLYPQKYYAENHKDVTIWNGRAEINGVIAPEDVEKALKKDADIQAVVITSPTYDGIVSDVEAIAEIVHRYQKVLIVDEAHGAHFGFHPYFPENSLKKGADLVIHSLHKTLPSMTQTALLHIGKNAGPLTDSVKKYLDIFETSSPSYVFMAGMDQCVRLIQEQGWEMFEKYAARLDKFRSEMKKVPHIHLLPLQDCKKMDSGKLVIAADGMNGQQLADILRKEYHLEVEMAAAGYVIALTTIADTEKGFERLKNALIHISKTISTSFVESDGKQEIHHKKEHMAGQKEHQFPKQKMTIAEACRCEKETVNLTESRDQICGEYIYLYPPGIPLAVPGEIITEELIKNICEKQEKGLEIQGLRDYSGKKVDVCRKVCYTTAETPK